MSATAVVTSSEENDFFSMPSLKRSHSQSSFAHKRSSGFHSSASTSQISDTLMHEAYKHPVHIVPGSSPSSAPSSPEAIHVESVDPSYTSTPATNLSLDDSYGAELHDQHVHPLGLAHFDKPFFHCLEDEELEPPASPRTDNSYTVSPTEPESSIDTSRPNSPACGEHAEDDTAARHHPTQHVDYLSHNWREEDIWSSWRYIQSKRAEYGNASRLENASWRTWMKVKYNLGTVSPETLNWLKDCDVTWLYGPLQTNHVKLYPHDACHGGSRLSRCDSFINKKPILKKRSMSEIMLQKSLSSSSLLKQATAAIQAQRTVGRSNLQYHAEIPRPADFISTPLAPRASGENTSLQPSSSTSGVISPSTERKHIHFDEQVTQCIAVDIKGDDEEDNEPSQGGWKYGDDSDSDDGAIMMKRARRKRPSMPRKKTPVQQRGESRTIAMLPSTTLKYRVDSPEPQETAMKHGGIYGGYSASSSQETLRPSHLSDSCYVGYEDDDEEDPFADPVPRRMNCDENGLSTPMSSPTESSTQFRPFNPQQSAFAGPNNNYGLSPAGMRRTDSGMLMPYEEGENGQPNDGMIGRMIDTVNTARDIAHVIWNVGWRR